MQFKILLSNLYYLLVHEDGQVNDKEVASGFSMAAAEGIPEAELKIQLEFLKNKNSPEILRECLMAIKKLNRKQQIRCVAWMCVIANADGFMDKAEWHFIYQLYHKELNLPLDEIMKIQKDLNTSFRERSSSFRPVKVAAA
ncbi:MAG: TerB family tellurite resistance protein [Cyclobacteriaceae bacterium]|nr:TerB family tellurite resistance protein [Cyclobacteriaceae bacterium]